MSSGLEEYWDGVDGPAERQVSTAEERWALQRVWIEAASQFSPGQIIFPCLSQVPAQAGIALESTYVDVS